MASTKSAPAATKPKAAPAAYIVKNVSPFGDLDLPLLGRVVEHGEEVELSKADAENLVGQPANWQPVGWTPDKGDEQ